MRKFAFFKQQSKSIHEGEEMISFDDMDVTCVGHVLKALATDEQQSAFKLLKDVRNSAAHGTRLSLSLYEFEVEFGRIFDSVRKLFGASATKAEKWLTTLQKVKEKQIEDLQSRKIMETIQNDQQIFYESIKTLVEENYQHILDKIVNLPPPPATSHHHLIIILCIHQHPTR